MAATLDRHWHLQVAARGAKQGWLLVALITKGRLILPNGQAHHKGDRDIDNCPDVGGYPSAPL
ncbi:hypothetical protein CFAM422_006010 [Trichoderma lentiforme]|uniref:Uncharacterized protein n=1 Tax=Trichoderma lentiforme TaxID=1567552 RepID=A0A9P5CFA1_9HYPO|nr:hypothetical protein CFAM422_006010 [Trichoderma lentiforme]